MAVSTVAEAQAIADKMVLENDGLPRAMEDLDKIGDVFKFAVNVGGAKFDLERFMAWNRKKERELLSRQGQTAGIINFKVSRKGTVSIYGLQRFPITLKIEQAEALFDKAEEFKQWVASNPTTEWPAVAGRWFGRGAGRRWIPAQPAMTATLQRGIETSTRDREDEGEYEVDYESPPPAHPEQPQIAGQPQGEQQVVTAKDVGTIPAGVLAQRKAG